MVAPLSFPDRVAIVKPDGTATPEFLRALNILLDRVGGVDGTGGGGSGTGTLIPAAGGFVVPPFTVLSGDPTTHSVRFPDTNPNGWNLRAGQMVFQGEFVSNGHFAQNPSAHLVVGLRLDTAALLLGEPRFHGITLGNLSGAQEGAQHFPTTQLESRATGLEPPGVLRYLLPYSDGPASKPLQDGVRYRVKITSSLSGYNERRTSYQLWRQSSLYIGAWDLEVDTGPMLDPNPFLDMSQQGLAFVAVFLSVTTPGAWSVDWDNMALTWLGIDEVSTDASVRMSRFDAQVEGDLTFSGDGRRAYVYNDSSLTNFADWTHVVSSVTNSGTSLVIAPNGTAQAAGLSIVNRSDLTSSFAAFLPGISNTRIVLQSFGVGTPALDIAVEIGGTTPVTFKATGMRMASASKDIGQLSTRLTGLIGAGGPNALALTVGAQNMEGFCTPGAVAAYLGATYNASAIEDIFRVIYAIASGLVADLNDKRVN